MLPAAARIRRPAEFTAIVRGGQRAAGTAVRVHLRHDFADAGSAPKVGFVVPGTVGPAVVRNRVKRRLRALMRERLDRLPAGCAAVVRAQPGCSSLSFAALGRDVDSTLARALARARELAP